MRAERVFAWVMGAVAAAFLVLLLWIVTQVEQQIESNAGRRFPAPSYSWPQGCPASPYRRERRLPKACAAKSYRLGSVWKLGLNHSRGTDWYRIGDDALQLRCQTFQSHCAIEAVALNKFASAQQP